MPVLFHGFSMVFQFLVSGIVWYIFYLGLEVNLSNCRGHFFGNNSLELIYSVICKFSLPPL